ncbi:beta-eliminating lyase-related protein [Pseudomonas orientalis]|uniref:beta-eliminating lyase-related protein n=1 Tax=Pseudomonas orientalis TaxID=76758 RepID=UPI00320B321A
MSAAGAGSATLRRDTLVQAGFNLDLVPAGCVVDDYQTDSLMNAVGLSFAPSGDADEHTDLWLSKCLTQLFGMPLTIPVAQGRLAEAMLSNVLAAPGDCVPGSLPFPTAAVHLARNGAVSMPMPSARPETSENSFCGDIDTAALARFLENRGRARVPCLMLEACTNAIGGHPLSIENLRSVRSVAERYGIPIYLDATRIFSNAYLIQQRNRAEGASSIPAIVLELCALVDGIWLSASKEFPVPVGGVLAVRDRQVFEQCRDQALLFGTGLDAAAKHRLAAVMADVPVLIERVVERARRVERFQALLAPHCEVVTPGCAHAVFLKASAVSGSIAHHRHPHRAFLNHLYVKYGVRGALNPGASQEAGDAVIRFAVPILGKDDHAIESAAASIRAALSEAHEFIALEEVNRPAGFSGALLATYRPVESIGL